MFLSFGIVSPTLYRLFYSPRGSSRRFFFYPCLRSATISSALSLLPLSFRPRKTEREIRIDLALPCPSPRGLPRTRRQTNYIIYNFELIWLHDRRHASHARLSWFLFKSLSVDSTSTEPRYDFVFSILFAVTFVYSRHQGSKRAPSNRFRSMVWRCPFLGFMGLVPASSNLLVDRDWTEREDNWKLLFYSFFFNIVSFFLWTMSEEFWNC